MSQKGAKRWYKDNRGNLSEKSRSYADEFDQSAKGRTLKKDYEKAIKEMESAHDWTDKDAYRFSKTEEKYLRAQMRYEGEKMLKELGEEKFSIYTNNGRLINDGKDAVEKYADRWWIHGY